MAGSPLGVFRPERLFLALRVVVDQLRRDPQHALGRSVVLFQPDDLRIGIILFEIRRMFRRSAPRQA